MKVKNPYTTSPSEVEVGDEFVFVIKAIVTDKEHYRLYRCAHHHAIIPEGSKIYGNSIVDDIFPVLRDAGLKQGT